MEGDLFVQILVVGVGVTAAIASWSAWSASRSADSAGVQAEAARRSAAAAEVQARHAYREATAAEDQVTLMKQSESLAHARDELARERAQTSVLQVDYRTSQPPEGGAAIVVRHIGGPRARQLGLEIAKTSRGDLLVLDGHRADAFRAELLPGAFWPVVIERSAGDRLPMTVHLWWDDEGGHREIETTVEELGTDLL